MGNRCPPSVKISLESGVGGTCRSSQQPSCGKGKEEAKSVKKLVSSGEKCGSFGSKDREAASAGRLCFPAQWGTVGTWLSRVLARMARARSNLALVGCSDRDIRLCVQLTVGELSENNVAVACRRLQQDSRMNHATNTPANSKSLLVISAAR
jgi:hypothetical protein